MANIRTIAMPLLTAILGRLVFSTPAIALAQTPSPESSAGFDKDSYSFTVVDWLPVGAYAGEVEATAPEDAGAITYSITAGNEAGKFAINSSTGLISVAGALSYLTTPSYTLTVSAAWGEAGKDTATVSITIMPEIGEVSVSSYSLFTLAGESVTLTASVEAATGVTFSYQWQVKEDGSWGDVETASDSPTTTVVSQVRAVKEYRVLVSHSSGASVTSPSEFVIWDGYALWGELAAKLEAQVKASQDYQEAETAFLKCVNLAGFKFESFEDVLTHYVPSVQGRADLCEGAAQSPTAMFDTYESLLEQKLNGLKAADTLYAAFLDTPLGIELEKGVLDMEQLKSDSAYLAEPPPGFLGQDLPDQVQPTGLGCVPSGTNTSLSLAAKLNILTCLVFKTPHSFWVNSSANSLKNAIDTKSSYSFLGRGDWECTLSPEGPVPSCLKHDVAYGGLQKFAGADSTTELDEAWNPRNKYLADQKFRLDIEKYGCQNESAGARILVCGNDRTDLADFYHKGPARVNHKGWPVTKQDVRHANISGGPKFVSCASSQLPNATAVTARQNKLRITVNWVFQSGCVIGLNHVKFEVDFRISHITAGLPSTAQATKKSGSCATSDGKTKCAYEYEFPRRVIVDQATVMIQPLNKEYGPSHYPARALSIGPFVTPSS